MKGTSGKLAALGLLGLIMGCGGGGGGGGSNGGGTPNPLYQVSIIQPSDSSRMIDPGTLFIGDSLQLQITSRDTNGKLITIPASGWTTNAPSNVATVSSSGVLVALASSGTNQYVVQVNVGGATYSATISVSPSQYIVTGLVRNTSNVGIESVAVLAYNGTTTLVGQTHTSRAGTFRMSVPSSAVRFTVDMSKADPGHVYYFTQFGYGSKEYLDGISCLTPLPTPLSSLAPTPLPNDIVPDLISLGPPPPPTGCVGP